MAIRRDEMAPPEPLDPKDAARAVEKAREAFNVACGNARIVGLIVDLSLLEVTTHDYLARTGHRIHIVEAKIEAE